MSSAEYNDPFLRYPTKKEAPTALPMSATARLKWFRPVTRDLRRGGIVGATAALVLIGVAGCGPSGPSESKNAGSSKPDLPDLSAQMVIPQSEFPVSSGEFKSYPVESGDLGTKKCSPHLGTGKIAFSVVTTETAKYRVNVAQAESRVDLSAWARDTMPCIDGGNATKQIDLPGLPPGSISLELGDETQSTPDGYGAMGYIRGLYILAQVVRTEGITAPEGAKSDVVKMFNAQANRLENY